MHPHGTHAAYRHPLMPARRRLSAHVATGLLALLALGAVGCNDDGPTTPHNPAAPAAETDALATDQTADQSAADPATAGSLAVTATRLAKSFFVNPITGKDTNPGTKLKPFKTLARGLSTAIAGDTMRLASGVYSKATNGERFTSATQLVEVPSGVTILGTPAEDFTTQLHGVAGDIGLFFQGSATVRDVILSGFRIGIRARQGVHSLKNLILKQDELGLELAGSARTTLVGGSVFVVLPANVPALGVQVREGARFIMDGGIITGGAPNCAKVSTGVRLQDAAQATFRNNATLRNIAGQALVMGEISKALLKSGTTIDGDPLPGGCTPFPQVRVASSAALTLQNARIFGVGGTSAVGIQSDSDAPLMMTGSTITGFSSAALLAQGTQRLTVSVSSFSSNNVAIDAANVPPGSLTITRSSLRNNGIGIRSPLFKLRNSEVIGNGVGIEVFSVFADLGQVTDPGNNAIFGNTDTGVRFSNSVVNGGTGGIFAAGNTWNPSTQGSDASGHYPGNPAVNGLSPLHSGKNFVLPGTPGFVIQL